MADMKTYAGGCHCGHVRFQTQADLGQVMACNCSICTQRGLLLTFVPAAQFTLESGGADLTEYRFNKHVVRHLFCPNCGVEAFARGTGPDGAEMVALNVRSLDGIDISTLNPQPFDGRSL
ncbi:MAG TPA: GFA family protein [Micropepsaceae bacterium]|nr:GFA family protein [Micropepsaceae bacterium]